METMSSSSSPIVPHEPSNYEELSMEMSLLFSDSLKDLKNLRTQLYSAAEYFEVSYTNDDQKEMVVDTLKDYTIKALVNTVDHLGSVSFKVNGLFDEKVDEVSGTELRVSSIEQRLQTCQEFIDHEGRTQQSLVIRTPKYHKHYILPVAETMSGSKCTVPKYQGRGMDDQDNWHQLNNAAQATTREAPPSSARKGRSLSPSPRSAQRPGTFSFTDKQKVSEKRTASPLRSKFPLLRSGSLSSRSTTPHSSRPTTPILNRRSGSFSSRSSTPQSSRPTTPILSRPATPNSSNARQRHSSDLPKSASMRHRSERDNPKDIEQYPSKSKRLLKALLSRRKSKKDEMLYTFLDEY